MLIEFSKVYLPPQIHEIVGMLTCISYCPSNLKWKIHQSNSKRKI